MKYGKALAYSCSSSFPSVLLSLRDLKKRLLRASPLHKISRSLFRRNSEGGFRYMRFVVQDFIPKPRAVYRAIASAVKQIQSRSEAIFDSA